MNSRLPLILLLLALAGCDRDDPETVQNRAAAGEVLEGTISDEMLPYDKLVSRPPFADPEAAESAIGAAAVRQRRAPAEAEQEAEGGAEGQPAEEAAEAETAEDEPAEAEEPAGE